ncbi:MAG: hypothetical protein PHE09_11860 [Oscillospiraceae bacterium]|nr:hypothetical protein [Oscillospiraceae bacterium]
MQKGLSAMATGVAVAMAAGTAAYMLAGTRRRIPVRRMKRSAGRALRAVEGLVDGFAGMMR